MNRKTKKPLTKFKKRKRSTNKPRVIDPLKDLLIPRGGYRR